MHRFWPKEDYPLIFCDVVGVMEHPGAIFDGVADRRSIFNQKEAQKVVGSFQSSVHSFFTLIQRRLTILFY